MCVMSGTALAGGFIMSLAHDFRLIRADAKIALSEIDVGLSFGNSYSKLCEKTLGIQEFQNMMFGNKLKAKEAYQKGIVQGVFSSKKELDN